MMLGRAWISAALPLVFLAACGGEEKTADTLVQDSALAHDIAMAGRDSLAEPVMTDLSTGAPAAEPATTSAQASPRTAAPASRTAAPASRAAAPVSSRAQPAAPSQSQPSASRRGTSAPVVSVTPPGSEASVERVSLPRPPASAPPIPLPKPRTDAPVPAGSAGAAPPPRSSGGRVLDAATAESSPRGTIPAGSSLALNADSKVCTNTNRVGQRFNATVARSVSGSNGTTIPAGATAVVEITELKRGGNDGDPIRMGFRVASVSFGGSTYPIDATATSASIARIKRKSPGQAEKIAGGAAIGAVAGQVIGKNTRSTVTGAVVGAAVGAAAAAASASTTSDGCVPSGGRINTSLNSSLLL